MKQKPLLFIPVETRVRELDAKLFLALVALRHGFDVILGEQSELVERIDLLDRGIYLDKSIASSKNDFFEKCSHQGILVTAVDEEGLVYFSDEVYRELRIFPSSMKNVSLFFAWGEDQKAAMTPAIGAFSDRIKVTGNPRFDLLRPELRQFYRVDTEKLRTKFGRIILVNTNFAFANHFQGREIAFQALNQFPIASKRPGFLEGWAEAQKRVMDSFCDMLPPLQHAFSEHTIVIRPHPSESLKPWQELAAGMPKTVVCREGNVIPWIMASDALLHWNCTTAIEAYILGVPAIAFLKERFDCYEQHLTNSLSYQAQNIEQLINFIKATINGIKNKSGHNAKEKTLLVEHHIAALKGEFASERIIKEIKTISELINRDRLLFCRALRLLKRPWRSFLKMVDKSRRIRDEYICSKFPDISAEEVYNIISKLKRLYDIQSHVHVEEEGQNCFRIYI